MSVYSDAIEEYKEREYELAHCRECELLSKRANSNVLCPDPTRRAGLNKKELINKVVEQMSDKKEKDFNQVITSMVFSANEVGAVSNTLQFLVDRFLVTVTVEPTEEPEDA